MARTSTFVSFDYDNDEDLKVLLVGQAKHPDSPFWISDCSIKEAVTDWKAKARNRIKNADVICVVCGEHTHTATGVAAEVSIARDESKPYFLLWGRSNRNCTKPSTALATDKIYEWTWPNLKALIGGSR